MPQSNSFEKAKSGFKKFVEEDKTRQVVVEKTQESIERETGEKLPSIVERKGKKKTLPRYDSGKPQKPISNIPEQKYVTYTPKAWMQYKEKSYKESIQAHIDINKNWAMLRGWERVMYGFTEMRRRQAIGSVSKVRGEAEQFKESLIEQKAKIDFDMTYQYADSGQFIPGHVLYKDINVKLGEVNKYLSELPTDEQINKIYSHDYKQEIDTQVRELWKQKTTIPKFETLVKEFNKVTVMPYTVIKREVDSKTGEMGGFVFYEDPLKKAEYSLEREQNPFVKGYRVFTGHLFNLPSSISKLAIGTSVDYWGMKTSGEPITTGLRKQLKQVDIDVKLWEHSLYTKAKGFKDVPGVFVQGMTSPTAFMAYIGLGFNLVGFGASKITPALKQGFKKLNVKQYIPKVVKDYPSKFADVRIAKQIYKSSLQRGKPSYITPSLRGSLLMGTRAEPLYYSHAMTGYEKFMYKPVYGTPTKYSLFQEKQAFSKIKQIKLDIAHKKYIETRTLAVMHPDKPTQGLFVTTFGKRDMFSHGVIKGKKIEGITYYKLSKTDVAYQTSFFKTKLQSKYLGEVRDYSLFESKGLSFGMKEWQPELLSMKVKSGIFETVPEKLTGYKGYTLQKNIYAGETFLEKTPLTTSFATHKHDVSYAITRGGFHSRYSSGIFQDTSIVIKPTVKKNIIESFGGFDTGSMLQNIPKDVLHMPGGVGVSLKQLEYPQLFEPMPSLFSKQALVETAESPVVHSIWKGVAPKAIKQVGMGRTVFPATAVTSVAVSGNVLKQQNRTAIVNMNDIKQKIKSIPRQSSILATSQSSMLKSNLKSLFKQEQMQIQSLQTVTPSIVSQVNFRDFGETFDVSQTQPFALSFDSYKPVRSYKPPPAVIPKTELYGSGGDIDDLSLFWLEIKKRKSPTYHPFRNMFKMSKKKTKNLWRF